MIDFAMVVALAASVMIGVSLGLLGGGGSILTLPILIYLVHLEPRAAIATSLLVVGATSLVAAAAHARKGRVRLGQGLAFGAASMVSAFAGGSFAHLLPTAYLLAGFSVIMVITGVMMLRPRAETAPHQASLFRITAVGLLVGGLTGLVGAGGGFVVVPALALLCGLPIAEAIGTSLLVIALNSFAGFAGAAGHVHVDLRIAAFVTAAAVLGSLGGVIASSRLHPHVLRRAFAVLVLSMAALMTFQQTPASVVETVKAQLMVNFTPWTALIGGALIGVSASLLLLLNGRIAGISGIVGGMLRPQPTDTAWRVCFVAGLLFGGALLALLRPESFGAAVVSLPFVLAGGLLVGFGTRLGSGCTSGHGVCGISRLSRRSIAATLTFMSTGVLATFVVQHWTELTR